MTQFFAEDASGLLKGQPTSAGGSHLPTFRDAHGLAPVLAAAAQAVYDAWDETDVDTYAGGGICHLIADAIVRVLEQAGIEAATVCSNFEVHVFTVCQLEEGVFTVDIPHSIYERGGGYSWTKIPGVVLDSPDIRWEKVDTDPQAFARYCD